MTPKTHDRASRSKTGCMTCRWRKKKCDEVKPRCAGCRRNQLACEWPSCITDSRGRGEGGLAMVAARRHSPSEPTNEKSANRVPRPVTVLHAGLERPCALTPQSVILLGYFLKETAGSFAMTPLNDNPFVTLLLPLGHVDDLLMHGLLAVSGAHLTYQEPEHIQLDAATMLHYSRLITGLREEFATLREDDVEKSERLLRLSIVACHYEAVSGDTSGTIFNHLRASRYLIQSLLASANGGCQAVNRESLGLSMELYAYLVFCNTFTPYGLAASRTLPLDTFITSMEGLASFPTFGVMFAGSHDLYRLVPMISLMASHRLNEEANGFSKPSTDVRNMHDDIYARLASWTMPPASKPNELAEDRELRWRAAEALRHALHIYLATALVGETVTDPDVREGVMQHVRALFTATSILVAARRYIATILWPIVIAGSCMVSPTGQQELLRSMNNGWFQMRQLGVLGKLLTLLWNDPDPRAYGPYGLYLMMEKHGLNIANL